MIRNYDSRDLSILWGPITEHLKHPAATTVRFQAADGSRLEPRGITITDVDGQEPPELVVTLNSTEAGKPGWVDICSGPWTRADGVTRTPALRVGVAPRMVAVADVNNDGSKDLVVACEESPAGTAAIERVQGEIDILLNGSIEPDHRIPATSPETTEPESLLVANFTSDEAPDILVSCRTDVFLLKGRGNGTFEGFAAVTPIDIGKHLDRDPEELYPVDRDGDGRCDLVLVSDEEGNRVVMLESRGDGTFDLRGHLRVNAPEAATILDPTKGPYQGHLAVMSRGDHEVKLFAPLAPGLFHTRASEIANTHVEIPDPAGGPQGMLLGLYENRTGFRGVDTIVAVNEDRQCVQARRWKTGSWQHVPVMARVPAPEARPVAVASTDLNRDTLLDVIVTWQEDNGISYLTVLTGREDGLRQETAVFHELELRAPLAVAACMGVTAGDMLGREPLLLNGDRWPDLAVAAPGTLYVFLNDGTGRLLLRHGHELPGARPVALLAAKQADGTVAFIVVDGQKPEKARLSDTAIVSNILTGRARVERLPLRQAAVHAVLGTFNGDAYPDCVILHRRSQTVLLGTASGGYEFELSEPVDVGLDLVALAAGDIDRDGIDDLLMADRARHGVLLLLNDSRGRFTQDRWLPAGLRPEAVMLGDFTGPGGACDGNPEFFVTNAGYGLYVGWRLE